MTKLPSDPHYPSPSEQVGVLPTTREEKLLRILSGEDRSGSASLIRGITSLLAPLYGLGIMMYRWLYDLRTLQEVHLPCPVVSIGNLTVGGTGKTGLALTLARLFQDAGMRPAILNYGYHAEVGRGPAIVSDGNEVLLTPKEAGDEAVLLAKRLPGAPVLIGKRRIESGALAVERFQPDLLILDDAFQYWRLARDVNLVLINATEPWGYGALLPRGLMRELPSALRRATGVVLTHTHRVNAAALRRLEAEIHRLAPRAPVFIANYAPVSLRKLGSEERAGLEMLSGSRVGALSALGSPADFEAILQVHGVTELTPYRYPDHYTYRDVDLTNVCADAVRSGLSIIVTTDKDAVKLETLDFQGCSLPICVLEAEMRVEPWTQFSAWILQEVTKAAHQSSANEMKKR